MSNTNDNGKPKANNRRLHKSAAKSERTYFDKKFNRDGTKKSDSKPDSQGG